MAAPFLFAASGALFEVSAVTFEAGIALDVAALAVEPTLPNLSLVVVDALTLGAGKLIGRLRYYWGNLFHAQNKQGAKYTNPQNNLKGLQTAGGNKFVMSDAKDAQTILVSNSNNKGTAVEVGFKGDGSISIKSNGPISLTAGGNITLTATKDIVLTAENVTINARQKLTKTAKKVEMTGSDSVDITGKATALKAGDTMHIAATSSLEVTGGSKASISSGKTRIH